MASRAGWVSALARGLCPRCRSGNVFGPRSKMNIGCPVCGLRFDREHGYFTGAMYVSYGLGIPIITLFTLVLWLCVPKWPLWAWVLGAWLLFLPLVPWVYRFSRVAWIYLDRALDRDDEADGGGGANGPLD